MDFSSWLTRALIILQVKSLNVSGCFALSSRCLQQLFQFFDRFSILRADWVVTAARIRSLQSTNHRTGNRKRCATVVRFAHEVPVRSSWNVTAKTVPAKSIDYINGSSFANLCSIFLR